MEIRGIGGKLDIVGLEKIVRVRRSAR